MAVGQRNVIVDHCNHVERTGKKEGTVNDKFPVFLLLGSRLRSVQCRVNNNMRRWRQ